MCPIFDGSFPSQFDKNQKIIYLDRSNWYLKYYLILGGTPGNATIKTALAKKWQFFILTSNP